MTASFGLLIGMAFISALGGLLFLFIGYVLSRVGIFDITPFQGALISAGVWAIFYLFNRDSLFFAMSQEDDETYE